MDNNDIRILVVDDEQDLCEILKINLETEGYTVDTANSAAEAFDKGVEGYDLLLLDVMMDEMSGFDMARRIKDDPDTADKHIIFITARDTEDDTVKGLNIGADDYISKPFSLREMVARVKAVLRRTREEKEARLSNTVGYKGLRLNLDTKKVTIDGKEVPFTRTEFELLRVLMEDSGRVFSRQQMIRKAWPNGVFVSDRTVDVNITRVRKKIEPYSKNIVTRLGFGYYFDE